MAEDYISELEAWTDNDYYENNVTKIQLPYNAAVCILKILLSSILSLQAKSLPICTLNFNLIFLAKSSKGCRVESMYWKPLASEDASKLVCKYNCTLYIQ